MNHLKRTKNINIHYSPILYVCMNKQKGRVIFKNFLILLDIGCSSVIIKIRLIENLNPKKMM